MRANSTSSALLTPLLLSLAFSASVAFLQSGTEIPVSSAPSVEKRGLGVYLPTCPPYKGGTSNSAIVLATATAPCFFARRTYLT